MGEEESVAQRKHYANGADEEHSDTERYGGAQIS